MAALPIVGQNKTDSTRTVVVGCKLPHGLVLRIFAMVDTQEPVSGGGSRTVKVAQERGERVVLNGWSHPQNEAPNAQIIGGTALTFGVDKDFWDTWLTQHKDSDMVKNGLIFAQEGSKNIEAEAKEKVELRSGLERLDPNKLPRNLETSELQKKV